MVKNNDRGIAHARTNIAEALSGLGRAGEEAGLLAGALPGGRRLDDPADRAELEALWGTPLPAERGRDLEAILTDAAAGRIDVLHLIGVDLARDAASPELARAAMQRVKTVIAQDLAATDTVREYADVVLPAAGTQERAGSRTNWEGRTQRFARAVDAPGLVQEDWEILVQLAALLGHDLGINDLDGVRGELERLGLRATPHDWPVPEPTDAASGDPSAAAGDEPATAEDLGFTLLARPLLLDRATMLAGADDLLATARAATATLAAADAASLGVADGDHVELAGAGQSLTLPVRVAADLVAGVVLVPTNTTEVPVAALTGRDGGGRVTVTPVAATEDAALVAGEVA